VFMERCIFCFIDDSFGVENRHHIGVEHICWECDYPHSDSTWPTSPEQLSKALADVPDDEVRLITHENAMRFFQYDPFAHVPKDKATVGALRADATDVDISSPEPKKAARNPDEGAITILDIMNASGAHLEKD
jgi:Amidohydrolase